MKFTDPIPPNTALIEISEQDGQLLLNAYHDGNPTITAAVDLILAALKSASTNHEVTEIDHHA